MDKSKSINAIVMSLLLMVMLVVMAYTLAMFGMKPALLTIVAYGLGMFTNFFLERSI